MPVKITVLNNASNRVEGDFEIYDQEGKKFELAGKTNIFLCRCGGSGKKPFCDGTHKKIAFKSEVKAG